MKNKQGITVFDIPLGMCLSVENDQTHRPVHPVGDASLTGCGLKIQSFQINVYMLFISRALVLVQ